MASGKIGGCDGLRVAGFAGSNGKTGTKYRILLVFPNISNYNFCKWPFLGPYLRGSSAQITFPPVPSVRAGGGVTDNSLVFLR